MTNDDLANIDGNADCNGVVLITFMNALFIDTKAYGVHEIKNIPKYIRKINQINN